MKKTKIKKRPNTMLRRYFIISAAIIVAAFIIISLSIMIFVANQWWTEKVDLLVSNSQSVASLYSDQHIKGKKDFEETISGLLGIMSKSTESDYFITDTNGKILFCGDESLELGAKKCPVHSNITVPKEILEKAGTNGFSDYINNDETFGFSNFVVSVPIKLNGDTVAIVFAIEDAVTGLLPYVTSIAQFMVYAVFAIVTILFIIISLIMRSVSKPLEEMQKVTKHIANGEFEYRANENYSRDFGEFAKSLNKMAYELSIDDEAKKSFVANVSHELKTPMTTIGGFIDGILDGTIPKEEERKYLGIVSGEVKRLSRMVVSMLNLSKIEAGEVKISPFKYDVGKQIFETLLLFEKTIDEKNISVEGFENINEVMIDADRDLLQQVLYNLLDNAVKFTPENGHIWIFASRDEEKTFVKIRNSGQGVSNEEISRIFERFYKVDKSRSYDVKGVGLGLYIVKTVINMHEGKISAGSKENEYTEFYFEIPVR